mmetsp:Transcript_9563/g.39057  ORF Transcript_9563/g.39057 Transcript_9563/m.39057 type:complete len:295 (+) Transcript_9563:382-1266(+)
MNIMLTASMSETNWRSVLRSSLTTRLYCCEGSADSSALHISIMFVVLALLISWRVTPGILKPSWFIWSDRRPALGGTAGALVFDFGRAEGSPAAAACASSTNTILLWLTSLGASEPSSRTRASASLRRWGSSMEERDMMSSFLLPLGSVPGEGLRGLADLGMRRGLHSPLDPALLLAVSLLLRDGTERSSTAGCSIVFASFVLLSSDRERRLQSSFFGECIGDRGLRGDARRGLRGLTVPGTKNPPGDVTVVRGLPRGLLNIAGSVPIRGSSAAWHRYRSESLQLSSCCSTVRR